MPTFYEEVTVEDVVHVAIKDEAEISISPEEFFNTCSKLEKEELILIARKSGFRLLFDSESFNDKRVGLALQAIGLNALSLSDEDIDTLVDIAKKTGQYSYQ